MRRKIFRKKASAVLLIFLVYTLAFPLHIFALPQGGDVVGGQAQISEPDTLNMHINQSTQQAIINWQEFGISPSEAVRFFQPNAAAVALNRVIGIRPTEIYGLLSANGQIFIINSNGIL